MQQALCAPCDQTGLASGPQPSLSNPGAALCRPAAAVLRPARTHCREPGVMGSATMRCYRVYQPSVLNPAARIRTYGLAKRHAVNVIGGGIGLVEHASHCVMQASVTRGDWPLAAC